MGFELGYSMENPHALVLWEAQFGDFVNGAQIIIDQFLSSGEDKWLKQNGLVLLLPHGYEGQGPEHSSARLERFLQMTNEHPDHFPTEEERRFQIQNCNWQIVNLTTPANYFHALRRQIFRNFRKPLIVMSPKVLLRHPSATSSIEEFKEGERMQWVIGEQDKSIKDNGKKVKRLIFCSGKVYYDLVAHREKNKIKDVAIVRVEQLAPFPFFQVREEARLYPSAEVVWVQEEPMNQGAWSHVQPRLVTSIKGDRGATFHPVYVGRQPSASTAVGYASVHNKELQKFLKEAMPHS
jgi:2-oxoglutarate dehydrogenase E1 component